jgi:hypothetical protein
MRYNNIVTPEQYLLCKFIKMMFSSFSGQSILNLDVPGV